MSLKNCKSILVTVDFSDDSLAAVREGLVLAKLMQASVILLHVVHDPFEDPGFYHKKKDRKKTLRLMSEAAEEAMKAFVNKNNLADAAKKDSIKLDTDIARGIPAGQIINAATKHKVGMVVVGSSGKSGLSHLLLGSTAERVIQMANIPVMVVTKAK